MVFRCFLIIDLFWNKISLKNKYFKTFCKKVIFLIICSIMKLVLKIADVLETKQIQLFFWKYLDKNTPWIINDEYLCPFWVSSNIKRWKIVIIKNWLELMWALRFYPRKTDNIVSVYQFVLDERIRWKWLLKKMLEKTWYKSFQTNCFLDDYFNNYYKKTWWKLLKNDYKFNYWKLEI